MELRQEPFQAPTLLIGLGGLGSQVVDRVYARVPEARRGRIAVHAFDTNVNDIARLHHLKGRVTQTSERWTVGQYLQHAGEIVKEWFPHEVPELGRKMLTEGAGQVRAVSRLAYRAAMESGRLVPLEHQVADVFRARGDEMVASVRVVVASSLAGGTGAGLFLQTAMYLRELLGRTHRVESVLVRGAFLLPDALIHTGVLDRNEWENVRANAYASLKELNAITANASGAGEVTIDMEYRPNQTDAYGRPSLAVTERQLPYDFVFLYDFENTRGENLGHLERYLDQVARTVHLQLFTPVSAGSFSQEDNQILGLVRNEGRSRYCGAGVARLVYPYEGVLAYAALRWATDSLSEEWLKLDEAYEEEYRAYERDLQAGVVRKEPRLAERYVWLLENYASGDRPPPFVLQAHRATRVLDERGRPGRPKAALFVEAVEAEVERVLREDTRLTQLEEDCRIDEGRLKDRGRVRREVIDVEDALLALEQAVLEAVNEYKVFLVNRILLQDADVPGGAEGQPYRLNTWLLRQPEPLHPVAARAVLYEALLALEERLQTLTAQNEDTLRRIRAYERAFDLPETEDLVETPADRVRAALDQPWWQRVMRNAFKEFSEEYLDKASGQLRALVRFKEERLTELVFDGVRRGLRDLLDEWERYFRNLRQTRNHLLEERHARERAHEGAADPTEQFVLATAADKQRLWEEVRIGLAGRTLPPEIARQIYLGHYRRFAERQRGGRVGEQQPERTEAMFREDVVAWCRAELAKQDALALDLAQALRKEAAYRGAEPGPHASGRIERLTHLARPWVPEVVGHAEIHFWGLHPDVAGALPEVERDALFGAQLIADAAFSPYEAVRYRAHYGLKVEDFPKFSAGSEAERARAGEYYLAYRERVRRLEEGRPEVTPHLDKRWHVAAYLPDLNPEQVEREKRAVDEAWLRGLLHGLLRVARHDGRALWYFHRGDSTTLVHALGEPVPGHLFRLHDALDHNPAIVREVRERVEQAWAEDLRLRPRDLDQHAFVQGCRACTALLEEASALEVVLRFADGAPSNPEVEGARDRLLAFFLTEVQGYYRRAYGAGRTHTADAEAARLIEAMAAGSERYREAEPGSREARTWHDLVGGRVRALQQA